MTIGKWDISINCRARCPWTHFKRHRLENGWHIVWGKLSIELQDWKAEVYAICAQCDSTDIGEVSHGDEGWTVCQDCQSVEQGYRYVNKREFEQAS